MNEALKSTPAPRSTHGERLRDLDEQAFRARYHCDRFTATVLGNRLRYAVQHMGTGLMFNAFSPIIRDTISRPSLRTTNVSGVVVPPTMLSPRP